MKDSILKEIAEVSRGGSPRPITSYITNSPNGINWIRISDASEDGYIYDTEEKITSSGAKKSFIIQPGDLLLSNSMSFGRPYISKITGCIHDGWLSIRAKSDINSEYLKYYLSSSACKRKFQSIAAGGVVSNLNKEIVGDIKLFLPSLNEQKTISDLLILFDQTINIVISKTNDLKKYKEGLIGALYITCQAIESYPLKYFLDEYSEKNQNNYKAVAVGKNGIRSRDEIFSKEITKDVSKNKVISKNTLIIGMGTKEIDIGVLTDDVRLSVSPAYRTFKIKNIDPIYLEQILASENKLLSTRFMVKSARQGKTVDVHGFLNHKIYIHNHKTQEDISKLTVILNELTNVVNKKLDACIKIKRFLLDNMFI